MQQPLVLLFEAAVVLIQRGHSAGPVKRRFGGGKRPRQHIERRRDSIAQRRAEFVEHRLIGLADNDDRAGQQDQGRQRGALDPGADLRRQPDHGALSGSVLAERGV